MKFKSISSLLPLKGKCKFLLFFSFDDCSCESVFNFAPVDDFPDFVKELGSCVFVVNVVCVLPNVNVK